MLLLQDFYCNTSGHFEFDSIVSCFVLSHRRNVLRLHEADSFDDLGGISLKLIVLLALSWIILFFCLLKGVETSGKVGDTLW